MKLSVVIPVFCVESTLDRCVESVLAQDVDDMEVILVDDGSPDECPRLCDEWAKRDSRISVIHKSNGGLSDARNAGLDVAKGDYIGFVDSDDDAVVQMYECMLNVALITNVDIVMSDYIRFFQDGKKELITKEIKGGLYKKERIRSEIYPKLIMTEAVDYGPCLSVWQALYKKSFLDTYYLKFDEQVKWSEDNIFSAMAAYCCTSLYYMKGEGLYHYWENPGSITTSYRNGAWDVYRIMNKHLHAFFDNVQDYDFSRQLKLHIIYYACSCVNQEIRMKKGQAELRRILSSPELKEAFKGFQFPKVSYKFKLYLLLMKYRFFLLLYLVG